MIFPNEVTTPTTIEYLYDYINNNLVLHEMDTQCSGPMHAQCRTTLFHIKFQSIAPHPVYHDDRIITDNVV